MTLPTTPREFLEKVTAWALDGHRLPVGLSIDGVERGQTVELHQMAYRPFVPRWFITSTSEGFALEDVGIGQQSLFGAAGDVPATAYAVTSKMLEDPNDPGWQRVRLDLVRGEGGLTVIHPYSEGFRVRVRRLEDDPNPAAHRPFCCAFLGQEASRRMWETTIGGKLVLVGVTADGCVVDVRTPSGNLERIAIKPSDVAGLVERLGGPISFTLQTGK